MAFAKEVHQPFPAVGQPSGGLAYLTPLATPRPRILHCLRAPVGGLFRHVLDLSAEQAARGHAVGILADRETSDALTASRLAKIASKLELGITLIPMHRAPGLGDTAATWSVFKAARRLGVNVLHGHGAKGGLYARLAAGMARFIAAGRTTSFYTPHGGSLHYAPTSIQGRLIAAAERGLSHLTDGLIFESQYAAGVFARRFGQPGCSAQTIANGLQPADFAPHEPHANAADFVFVGELRQLKGVDVLLQALAALNKQQPVRAIIVGDGPDANAFMAQARDLGLGDDTVSFPGARAAREAFAMGRCLVLPSRAESLPYVILEAAAAGLPLIATNVGGIPEIVKGSDTQLVPADDAAGLHDAMLAFLSDPKSAKHRAEALRSIVHSRFSVETMARDVLKFYASALSRR